jgi:hypothetical protein
MFIVAAKPPYPEQTILKNLEYLLVKIYFNNHIHPIFLFY